MLKYVRAALLMTAACLFADIAIAADGQRSHAAGSFALELDLALAGMVTSVEGGIIDAQVIEEANPSYYVKKHLGPVQYREFTFETEIGEIPLLDAWIGQTAGGKAPRRSGAFLPVDPRYGKPTTLEFQQALVTAIGFPACDVSAKDSGRMTLSIMPELIKRRRGDRETMSSQPHPRRSWRRSDFMLTIPGLDCRKVSKIDALTIKQTVVRDQIGQERDHRLSPGKIEYPDLVVTLPDGAADTWLAWHEAFAIEGKNDDSQEKTGTLVLLSHDRKTPLVTLTFHQLGIFSLGNDDQDKTGDRLRVKMYCERMTIDFHHDDDKDPASPKANASLKP